jgi:hypothetical protein
VGKTLSKFRILANLFTLTQMLFYFSAEEIPGSGEYNVNYQSINYKLEKQKLFIENLKKIEVSRPAFVSFFGQNKLKQFFYSFFI